MSSIFLAGKWCLWPKWITYKTAYTNEGAKPNWLLPFNHQMLMEHVMLCLHCPHLFLLAIKSLRPWETGASFKSLRYTSHIPPSKKRWSSWPRTWSLAEEQPGWVLVARTMTSGSQDQDVDAWVPDAALLVLARVRNLLSFVARKKLWLWKMQQLPIFCSWLLVSASNPVLLKAFSLGTRHWDLLLLGNAVLRRKMGELYKETIQTCQNL